MDLDGTKRSFQYIDELYDYLGVMIHQEFRKAGDLVFFSSSGRIPNAIGVLVSKDRYALLTNRGAEIRPLKKKPVRKTMGQIFSSNPVGYKRLTVANPQGDEGNTRVLI